MPHFAGSILRHCLLSGLCKTVYRAPHFSVCRSESLDMSGLFAVALAQQEFSGSSDGPRVGLALRTTPSA